MLTGGGIGYNNKTTPGSLIAQPQSYLLETRADWQVLCKMAEGSKHPTALIEVKMQTPENGR